MQSGRRQFILLVMCAACIGQSVLCHSAVLVLEGRKWKGCCGGPDLHEKSSTLVLTNRAMIVAAEGNAKHYCVQSNGRDVICGGETAGVVGESLESGTYTVFIGLRGSQRKASIRIELQEVETEGTAAE